MNQPIRMYQTPPSESPLSRLKTPAKMRRKAKKRPGSAGDPGGARLAHRPPEGAAQQPSSVHREGGNQVEEREDQVDQGQVLRHRRGRRAHERQGRARVEEARESQAHQGAGRRHPELGPPVPGVLLELGDASEDEQGDRPGAQAVAQGDDGVPQLVEDDRDEEEKRRHEALRPVGGGREIGILRREVARRQGPDDQAEDDQPAEVEVDRDPDHPCDLDVVRATAHAHRLPAPACPRRAPRSRGVPARIVARLVLDGLDLAGDPMNAVHRIGVLDGAQRPR